MPKGGARVGAGRKTRAEKFGDLKAMTDAEIESIVREEVPSALRELVRGHYREETNKDGTERIYRVSPNIQAILAAMDRAFGKVADKVQHSGELTISLQALKEIKERASC